MTFTAELFTYPGKGGWTFAEVPAALAPPATHGWGRTPVVAVIDGRRHETSVWRETSGRTLLPVSKAMRGTKGHGDPVTIGLTVRVTVRAARPADVSDVAAILREAAGWLRARGEPMWREDELVEERIAVDVEAGLVFVAVHADDTVGTVRFQLSDARFWPDVPEGDAVYIHRLAVRREFGRGLVAPALLLWAAERGRALGRRWLRLDCEASRRRLRDTYERAGFVLHSERQVGPYFVARYEMALGTPGVTPGLTEG
jgi:predicted N-acetyltransferase YhbS